MLYMAPFGFLLIHSECLKVDLFDTRFRRLLQKERLSGGCRPPPLEKSRLRKTVDVKQSRSRRTSFRYGQLEYPVS